MTPTRTKWPLLRHAEMNSEYAAGVCAREWKNVFSEGGGGEGGGGVTAPQTCTTEGNTRGGGGAEGTELP